MLLASGGYCIGARPGRGCTSCRASQMPVSAESGQWRSIQVTSLSLSPESVSRIGWISARRPPVPSSRRARTSAATGAAGTLSRARCMVPAGRRYPKARPQSPRSSVRIDRVHIRFRRTSNRVRSSGRTRPAPRPRSPRPRTRGAPAPRRAGTRPPDRQGSCGSPPPGFRNPSSPGICALSSRASCRR